MTSDMRGRVAGRDRLSTDVVHALQYLEAAGHQASTLMPYNPVARINTYSALMYSRLWERGIAPVPLMQIHDLDVLMHLMKGYGARVVLHQQWTSDILRGATSVTEAKYKSEDYLKLLDQFLDAGGQLVWTVHNVLPHDTPYPELEAAMQQEVANRARAIHVLNSGTVEAAAEWFRIPPGKAAHIPHPNYMGSYPDIVSRDQARWDLDLHPDEIVYAFVGAIKPYKGLAQFLDAFDAVASDGRPRRLLVAGHPDDDPATQAVLDRCLLHPHVKLYPKRVPDSELQFYLRAADVAVLPYQRSLNSGVLMLALSFGLPVLAPQTPATHDIVTPDVARTFEPGDLASLTAALAATDELLTTAAREEAARIARSFDTPKLAGQFADLIAQVSAA